MNIDLYGLLGVAPNASPEELRRAFLRIAKTCHPDTTLNLEKSQRDIAEKKFRDAQRAYEMGVINAVVPHADLEKTGVEWAAEILRKSPQSVRMLKFAFNAVDDGIAGQQLFAGEATRLAYGTDEAVEGRDSFLEKREPDWSPYPWQF